MSVPAPADLSAIVAGIVSAASENISNWKPQYAVPAAALAYLAVCRALRFRGETALRRRLGYPEGCGREKLAEMTNDEAQIIIKYLMAVEFPEFQQLSLQFGLFKTYGVESISRLLLATRNLTDPIKSKKRYEDTAALIGEFMINAPSSPRTLNAIARMNFLHGKYRAEGSITNADLLYTLSVFVVEPPRFVKEYEWRELNDMEMCAYGVFWKSVGDAMRIDYGAEMGKTEWRDGIEFGEDITAWAKAYEIEHMKPSEIANRPARALIPMITYWVPWFAKGFAQEMVCVLMGERVREAFMLPVPGIAAAALVYPALYLRRLYLRYLSLPRFSEVRRLAPADPTTGRMHTRIAYGNHPYYIKPTFWNRWGPKAWAIWAYGGDLPGDNPEEYMPQGYTWADLGPKNRMGLGVDEMALDVDRMEKLGRGRCPF